jgi:hypothetical protein
LQDRRNHYVASDHEPHQFIIVIADDYVCVAADIPAHHTLYDFWRIRPTINEVSDKNRLSSLNVSQSLGLLVT